MLTHHFGENVTIGMMPEEAGDMGRMVWCVCFLPGCFGVCSFLMCLCGVKGSVIQLELPHSLAKVIDSSLNDKHETPQKEKQSRKVLARVQHVVQRHRRVLGAQQLLRLLAHRPPAEVRQLEGRVDAAMLGRVLLLPSTPAAAPTLYSRSASFSVCRDTKCRRFVSALFSPMPRRWCISW